MTPKLHLLGLGAHCYFLKPPTNTCLWRKEVGPHMAKGCMGLPSVLNTMKFFSLNKSVFWSCRDCHSMKGGAMCESPIKRLPFPPWLPEPWDCFECHVSSFILVFLRGALPLLPCVFISHGLFQLTHFVSVIRQIRRSKITVSVVSHFFRSTGFLSKTALLDCSAWGMIDRYQVCSLFYIWLTV